LLTEEGHAMTKSANNRVLMLLENNPYHWDVRVKQEAETLAEAGYQVTVIAPRPLGDIPTKTVKNIHLYQFPAPAGAAGLMGYLWEYAWATVVMSFLSLYVLMRKGFDILHMHNPPDILVPATVYYKLFGKRMVYDHHDLAPEAYHARFPEGGSPFVHRVLVFFEKLSYRFADHVIVTNQSYKAVAMSRGNLPEERVTIVRNGPAPELLQCEDTFSDLRRDSRTIIMYVGQMAPQDGVDYLLRALHHVVYKLDRKDCLCVLVGAGTAVPSLKSLTEQLKLVDHTLFTGWVEQGQVMRYLNTADICVAPEPSNQYTDHSTMIKIMEYMAAEKPIVAFDLPEHRFSAQDAAVYACANDELDFAHRIAALMDAPQRREAMGLAGRERIIRELGWPHQARQLLQVYDTLSRGSSQNKEGGKTL
jgi:glycosyltransferase involved in cell wall biosynthesis